MCIVQYNALNCAVQLQDTLNYFILLGSRLYFMDIFGQSQVR